MAYRKKTSYAYDRYANLTRISSTQCSSPTMSISVNTSTYKNQITNTGYTYDNGGNLTSDGTNNYTWDATNRLTSAGGVTYTYDGDGKRVKKSNGTLYWYDVSGHVIEETDASGNLLYDYAYFNGQRVGRRDAAGNVWSYINDPLGSPRVIAGPNSTKSESDYYPFGGERVISDTLSPDNHYKFTGLERDSESGLDHTLFRQYSSSLGRWLSPDPICKGCTNPQKLNRYQYVLNNPVGLVDPLGLDDCPPGIAFCVTTIGFVSDGASGQDPGEGSTDLSMLEAFAGPGHFAPLLDGGDGGGEPKYRPECDESVPKNKTYLDFIRGHLSDSE